MVDSEINKDGKNLTVLTHKKIYASKTVLHSVRNIFLKARCLRCCCEHSAKTKMFTQTRLRSRLLDTFQLHCFSCPQSSIECLPLSFIPEGSNANLMSFPYVSYATAKLSISHTLLCRGRQRTTWFPDSLFFPRSEVRQRNLNCIVHVQFNCVAHERHCLVGLT